MTDGPQQDIEADGATVRASVEVEDEPVLAGGPLDVVWHLRLVGAGPMYVALGGDRVAGRLAGFSFSAALDGAAISFDDPAADRVDLGGPMGVQAVTAEGLSVAVLVNQFVTLERARLAIPSGGRGMLQLGCRWDMLLGGRPEAVFAAAPQPADLHLQVALHRDDEALRAVVRRQAEAVLRAAREDEDALARLVALRHPDTDAIATEVGGDADRLAWMRAALA